MSENDDNLTGKVVPFPIGRTMTAAIADRLVEYYSDLVAEPLPEKHVALMQRFDALAQEHAAPGVRMVVGGEKTNSAE